MLCGRRRRRPRQDRAELHNPHLPVDEERRLVFEIKKADVTTGTSIWYPLANLTETNERYKGQATVIG